MELTSFDAAAHPGDHPLNDPHQVRFVGKDDVRPLQQSPALHKDFGRAVDEDVVDRRVLHQAFQRSQPEDLVQEAVDQAIESLGRKLLASFPRDLDGQSRNLGDQPLVVHFAQQR